ncbi:MAG: hypothetical protein K8L91_00020 [Anaerolineae bacterium]|nr:hypothetical protein [Anaerolineae bacterium]
MKLRSLIFMLVIVILLPLQRAASQDDTSPEWMLAFNPVTSRLVVFEPQADTANIMLDETLAEGTRLWQVWRIGPHDFLAQTSDADRETYSTLWLSDDGLHDVSALFDWTGWESEPEPVLFEQGRLVMIASRNFPYPILYIMDLPNQQVQTFPAVDYISPRLSSDGSKIRFVAPLPDTEDQWEIMEYDLASGEATPLNLLQLTSSAMPLVNSDPFGDVWLRRGVEGNPPELIGIDGSVRTLEPPPTGSLPRFINIWHDRILATDLLCEADCMAYTQPLNGTEWTTYPMPIMLTGIIYGFVGDRLVVTDADERLYLATPDSPPQPLGYLSEGPNYRLTPGFTWSPDLRFVVFGDAPTFPTTVHVYAVETNQILLSGETESPNIVATYTTGGITLDLREETHFYRHADGQTFNLPPLDQSLRYGGAQVLPDGGIVFGVENHDVGLYQIRYFDPRTDDGPSMMLDGVTLRSVSPMRQP